MEANQILISFDIHAEMGFFKKPDINSGIYLTYNMMHRPALLGMLGAIIGLKGYEENEKLPEYYQILSNVKIGIQPLDSNKGNYSKTIIKYNNGTGFANDDGILNISEQVLISPSFRCYLILSMDNGAHKTLFENLKMSKAEYIPYFGKNEFSAWWSNVQEYPDAKPFEFDRNYKIISIFAKTSAVSGYVAKAFSRSAPTAIPFLYFERLPIGFDEKIKQYEYADFVYSNATFQKEMSMFDAGEFIQINDNDIIQLF